MKKMIIRLFILTLAAVLVMPISTIPASANGEGGTVVAWGI